MASIIGVQELQHTNGTSAATISSAGIITKPQTPAFRVTQSSSQTLAHATVTKLTFNTKTGSQHQFDTSSNWNTTNYEFTAPVSGVYFFKGQFFASVSTQRAAFNILIDTGSGFDTTASNDYLTQELTLGTASVGGAVYSGSAVAYLTAGHKVAAYGYQEQGSSSATNASAWLTHFSGFLVG